MRKVPESCQSREMRCISARVPASGANDFYFKHSFWSDTYAAMIVSWHFIRVCTFLRRRHISTEHIEVMYPILEEFHVKLEIDEVDLALRTQKAVKHAQTFLDLLAGQPQKLEENVFKAMSRLKTSVTQVSWVTQRHWRQLSDAGQTSKRDGCTKRIGEQRETRVHRFEQWTKIAAFEFLQHRQRVAQVYHNPYLF